jgi:hypothetical protein
MGEPQAAPPAASGAQMPGFIAALKGAELFIAAGAALIVLVDIVFVLLGPYGFSNIGWAVAVLALIVVFLDARMLGFSAATHRAILITLGFFMAVILVRDVIDDVLFLNEANVAVTYFLGMLGYYAGAILMVFGAWTLWKSRSA